MAGRGDRYSTVLKARIVELHDQGMSVIEIERALTARGEEVSWSGIRRHLVSRGRRPMTLEQAQGVRA